MKAYFINLDRSPDRREYMTRTLDGLGIAYERIAAVDGRTLTAEERAACYRFAPGTQYLDVGSIACFLSHRDVWQRIAAQEDAVALVLEDDILFGTGAKEILDDAAWIPASAELVRLETVLRHTVHGASPIATVGGRAIVTLHRIHNGSGAYIIRKEAAVFLLARTQQFSYAVDYILFDPHCPEFCGFSVLQMVPALCIQNAIAPRAMRGPDLPSLLQGTRKTVFARGPRRFMAKVAREFEKQRMIVTGRLLDGMRGRKTGRIPFR